MPIVCGALLEDHDTLSRQPSLAMQFFSDLTQILYRSLGPTFIKARRWPQANDDTVTMALHC
jgi:hypothetical protein